MKRGAALILAVLLLAAQKGDAPLRVKAFLCFKEGRNYCASRSQIGYEPARVRIEVYLPQNRENRAVGYGLLCDNFIVAESRGELAGDSDPPMLFVEHPDISAGDCYGVAKLARADGTVHEARSERIRIMALHD